jgi:hypothetical protein
MGAEPFRLGHLRRLQRRQRLGLEFGVAGQPHQRRIVCGYGLPGLVAGRSILGSNGSGSSGFSIPIPAALQDNRVHAVSVSYGTAQSTGTQVNIPIGGSGTQFAATIQCAPSATGYQYYFTDSFQSISTTNWIQNGSPSVPTTGWV